MRKRDILWEYMVIIAGGCAMALSVVLFYDPNNIVPGGLTGISMMINYKIPSAPIGMTILAMNIPLFIIGWRALGRKFLIRTLFGTISSTLIIDALKALNVKIPECEPLAAAVLGGVLTGVGLGLVFSKGSTTGGSDIAARLLKLAFPATQIGALMLFVDGCVVASSAFVFGSLNNAFFAIVGVFTATQVTDMILYGMNVQWTAYIMSSRNDEIGAAIHKELKRGTTMLLGEGGYSGMPCKVILCAVRRQQISALKDLVKETDPQAFIIVNKAYEVLGEGFRRYDKNRV